MEHSQEALVLSRLIFYIFLSETYIGIHLEIHIVFFNFFIVPSVNLSMISSGIFSGVHPTLSTDVIFYRFLPEKIRWWTPPDIPVGILFRIYLGILLKIPPRNHPAILYTLFQNSCRNSSIDSSRDFFKDSSQQTSLFFQNSSIFCFWDFSRNNLLLMIPTCIHPKVYWIIFSFVLLLLNVTSQLG